MSNSSQAPAKIEDKETKENEKLKRRIEHLEKQVESKNNEIAALREVVALDPKTNMPKAKGLLVPIRHTGRLVAQHIEIRLSPPHAQRLRDLFDGLYQEHAKLGDGKFIERPQQALVWLLENLIERK